MSKEDMYFVDVNLGKDKNTISKKSILKTILDLQINVGHQCLDGFCGTCNFPKPEDDVIKLKDGKDEYDLLGFCPDENFLSCSYVFDVDKLKLSPDGNYVVKFKLSGNLLPNHFKIEENKVCNDVFEAVSGVTEDEVSKNLKNYLTVQNQEKTKRVNYQKN
jgi:ferredoxin